MYVDITKSLTYYVNNPEVAEIITQSFRNIEHEDYASYADGSAYKRDGGGGHQIDVALYVDEADPLNPLGSFYFLDAIFEMRFVFSALYM